MFCTYKLGNTQTPYTKNCLYYKRYAAKCPLPKYRIQPRSKRVKNTNNNATEDGGPPNVDDGVQHWHSGHHARL